MANLVYVGSAKPFFTLDLRHKVHDMALHPRKQWTALGAHEEFVGCAAMGDEELYEKLTAVKGIGVLAMPVLDQSEHSTMAALI